MRDRVDGAVFAGADIAQITVTAVNYRTEESRFMECASGEALLEYLAGPPVSRLMGNFGFPDDTLSVMSLNGERAEQKVFYLDSEVDWAYIELLLV